MIERSKKHLEGVGESYFEHLFFTLKYGGSCFLAGFMVIMHGLVPSLFETGASTIIKKLAGMSEKDCREL